ncbi:MAG: hypothetical protein ACHP9Y_03240 [Gammaproteobacteria bacterium]
MLRINKIITSISLSLFSLSALAYQAIDLNIGRSVAFGYSTNLDVRGFGMYANGLWGLDHDNRLFSPGVRYNILPRTDQSFLDSVFVNASGFFAKLGEYDDVDVNALVLGGGARFKLLDEYSFIEKPVFLAAGISYAPPALTYSSGENATYWYARVEYPIFTQSLAYIGYRQITADINDNGNKVENASIDKTAFIGIHYVW